ncbi:tyrosine-type recombinase/integrase [Planomonospora venezuelensis]|uniref:Site-specific recombinase XerD n=1 Tax=Planomonospora venezuelensis TaxID=1999 RepID=A0A841DFL5_PLAVE|nr:site-specific recombinase XerD [Planomonospora venezuelensis]
MDDLLDPQPPAVAAETAPGDGGQARQARRADGRAVVPAGPVARRRLALAEAVTALPALGPVDPADPYGVHRLTAIWLETRASAATAAAYRTDLHGWLSWCARRRLDPLQARRADVDLYAADLATRFAAATVARKLSAVSAWYAYLISNDVCERNPAAAAERPGRERDVSATIGLSRAEAARFLAAAAADERPLRLRTTALLGVMLTEGVRVAEICGADVDDLGYNRGWRTLTVTRKGGKRQTLPLAPPIAHAVEEYLTDRAMRAGTGRERLTGPLFATVRSGPHPGGKRLDRWAVTKLIRRIARTARIPSADRLSPHSLRHTFATLALDAGVALRDVQDAMGHADPRTTRAYDRARYALDRHPATRLMSFMETASSEEPR